MGARAVLAKRTGRLAMKIIAISSICPGKTKANPRLRPVIANTNNNKVIAMRRKPPRLGHP
jgi:hypothetical protein